MTERAPKKDMIESIRLEQHHRVQALNTKRIERRNLTEKLGKVNTQINAIKKEIKRIDAALEYFTKHDVGHG